MTSGLSTPVSPRPETRGPVHAGRRKRRWSRIAFIATTVLLVVLILIGLAAIFYARHFYAAVTAKPCPSCAAAPPTGAPFTVLLVGSDSRAFVDNTQQQNQFGSSSSQSGQRSDVIIVAKVVPQSHQILMLSIPRDLWITIPGNVSYVSGQNRINAAFNNGPDLLVQTIQSVLHIPVDYFALTNFPGFSNIVSSLGGIWMNFPMPLKDKYSGLNITTTGCQLVQGTQALALVRSRHLYYYANGQWNADAQSDFSRIRRQDAFFRAVIARVHQQDTNPVAVTDFLSALTGDLTVSNAFKPQLFGLAMAFRGMAANALRTETLPTIESVTSGGADVLLPAQPYDAQMIDAFNAFGGSTSTSSGPPTTAALSAGSVHVQVDDGAGDGALTSAAVADLSSAGFVASLGPADANYGPSTSEIEYAPGHEAAAQLLASAVSGSVNLVSSSSLSGNNVVLVVASSFAGVGPGPSGTSGSGSGSSAPPPPSVVTNTQPEPWNPVTCNG